LSFKISSSKNASNMEQSELHKRGCRSHSPVDYRERASETGTSAVKHTPGSNDGARNSLMEPDLTYQKTGSAGADAYCEIFICGTDYRLET